MKREEVIAILKRPNKWEDELDVNATEIMRLHITDEINLLNELNQIAEDREFNEIAYFNLIYGKVKELNAKLNALEG